MHSLSKLALVATYVLAATAAPVTPDSSIKERAESTAADRPYHDDRYRHDHDHYDDHHRGGWVDQWGNWHPNKAKRDDTSTADRCDRERWDRGHGRDDCHFRYDEGRHGWEDRWGNFHPEVVTVEPVGGPVVVNVGHCDRERWDRGHGRDDCHLRYDEGRHGWVDKWGNFHPEHKKMKREEESVADRCDGQRWDNGHAHDDCHDHWDNNRHGWVDKWGNFHPGHKKAKREEESVADRCDGQRWDNGHVHDDCHDRWDEHRHGWVDRWGNFHPGHKKAKREEAAATTDADRPYHDDHYHHDHDHYDHYDDHHRGGWVDQWGNWHPNRMVKRDETATTTATTDADRPYHDDRYRHDHDHYDHYDDHHHGGWVDQWGNWHPN